jgi:hypothetical protein
VTVNPEFDTRGTRVDRAGRDASPPDAAALKGRYEEYCQQQVYVLLEIIPPEAVRPLYRRARIWATERGLHESKDPMSTLRLFCRDVLPLPPFEVWLVDYETHLVAHVGAGLGLSPLAEPMEPIAVEFRRMEYDAEPWHGTLEVYRGGDAWRGLIRFQRAGEKGHFRTGEIFREDNLQDLRDRFISFTAPTLSAFLRSTLP